MTRFNKAEKPAVNKAGGKAFKIKDPKEELYFACLTTFFKDTFYETGDERLERIRACIDLIIKKDPNQGAIWLCQLAIVLRENFNLRSVNHVIIGEVAKRTRGSDILARTIAYTAHRPDDLSEIAAYVGTPMPKQVKRGIRRSLQKFDRYQLGKYRMEGKEYSLVDLFNLTHPNPQHTSKEAAAAWKDLIAGKLKSEDTWETLLSNAKNDAERRLALCDLIAEDKIGYMALIRNLNNLQKYDMPPRIMSMALEKIVDADEIGRSKLMPFRFYNAYKNVKGNIKMTKAISEAMDIACLKNGKTFEGSILIAIDSSGSMHSVKDEDTSPFSKAAILAGIILKKAGKYDEEDYFTDVILYSDKVFTPILNPSIPLADLVQSIDSQKISGGTNTGLVFDHIAKEGIEYDRIIILSDNESWGGNVMASYTNMKEELGSNPQVFAIDIAGNGTFDIEGPNVTRISGWSDKILEFMEANQYSEHFINVISQVYIPTFNSYPIRHTRDSRGRITGIIGA